MGESGWKWVTKSGEWRWGMGWMVDDRSEKGWGGVRASESEGGKGSHDKSLC